MPLFYQKYKTALPKIPFVFNVQSIEITDMKLIPLILSNQINLFFICSSFPPASTHISSYFPLFLSIEYLVPPVLHPFLPRPT